MSINSLFRLFFIYSLVFTLLIGTIFSGADPSDPRNNEVELPNRESLIRAIKTGNLESVKKICTLNPECVFERDQEKNIALHYAAQSRHEKAFEIVAYLVYNASADSAINTRGKSNYTPLDLACMYGIKNVINYLKASGADNNRSISADSARRLYFGDQESTVTDEEDEEDGDDDEDSEEEEEYGDEDDEKGYDSKAYDYDSEKEY